MANLNRKPITTSDDIMNEMKKLQQFPNRANAGSLHTLEDTMNELPAARAVTPELLGLGRGSSGSSSSGSSGGGGAGTYSAPDYSGIINGIKSDLQKNLEESLAARQAAYDKSQQLYAKNRDSQLESLLSAYNYGKGQVNQDADRSLQEAYISRMQAQRTLPQMLSAQGITGGLSETTAAGLLNNYGNSRNSIETGRAQNLASLLNTYQTGKAEAEQNYNTLLAQAYDQLQQNIAADRKAYESSLASLMAYLG